jgi:hypothetical protein
MRHQDILKSKKARGRPATGIGTPVMVRLAEPVIDAIDYFRLEQQPPINRAATIRQFVVEALKRRGLLKVERK